MPVPNLEREKPEPATELADVVAVAGSLAVAVVAGSLVDLVVAVELGRLLVVGDFVATTRRPNLESTWEQAQRCCWDYCCYCSFAVADSQQY